MPRVKLDDQVTSRYAELGAIIKAKRVSLGWSRETLGVELNVSQQQIGKYELGLNRIDVIKLEDLSRAFNCPLSDFYGEQIITINQARATIDHMRVFNTLDKETKKKATDLIRTLHSITVK